jgi:type I restriction enzyme, S subunit
LKSELVSSNSWISQIPKGWNHLTLQKVCSKIVDNRGKTVPTSESGIPLIATNCIKNDKIFPTYERVRYVSEEIHKNWFRGHPEPGDIIFVNKGTPGLVCFVPDPIDFCIAQDMVALRVNENLIYPKFLFAVLRSRFFQTQVEAYFVGTMIPHLKKSTFNELVIPIPDPKIQKTIGNIYYDLSLQISNLEKMNFLLKKIIERIFRSWFIDFDGQTEFIDSELGSIPKGWKVKSIKDSCEKIIDYRGKTPKKTSSGIPLISAKLIQKGKIDFSQNQCIDSKDFDEWMTRGIPKKGDVVMTTEAPLGEIAQLDNRKVALSQRIITLRSKKELFGNDFLKCTLESNYFQNQLFSRQTGTTVQGIKSREFEKIPILVPHRDISKKFEQFSETITEKIQNADYSMDKLSKIRNTLLPKLMSGKLVN